MGSGILCCFPDPVDFDADINLFHFELHRAIGKGAFGKVRVVEHRKSKKLFALKYINKAQCVKQKAVANVIQERQLLEEVDHPFVVNLRYAFQDDSNCFFALDLMLGGDLRFHLERKGAIEESAVRFWVAELSCALSYLHKQRIIHRDIKPDNVLLDIMGHAHITDFNVAIHYSSSRLHTSVAGSLAYMAPEVCGRKGYSWQADWWSLGVCAYELIFGRRPFEGRSGESLTGAILKEPLRFPERAPQVTSEAGINALKQLIERNPKKRLGCRTDGGNLEDIRMHPWFSSVNWELLEEKDAQPPFVPDMRKANFDITHELDEFLMVEKPLTATKRKQNVDLDKLAPEYRQLEEQFTNFDYTKPKRMSYYPHNQPIMVAAPHGDGEDSLDITRASLQSQHSKTLVVGVTTAGSGSRTSSPVREQAGGQHAAGAGSPLAAPPSITMPTEPDRAHVRLRVSGDNASPTSGGGAGTAGIVGEALAGPDDVQQATPRRSAGSARSARSTSARSAVA